jgi:hypothetical protein
MTDKLFHIGDILSISTGILVSKRKMDGVYEILNWMLSDNLFTHQLPRAAEQVRPELLKQLPWLSEIEDPWWTKEGAPKPTYDQCMEWTTEQAIKYGTFHRLTPLSDPVHINPLVELVEKIGSDKTIVAVVRE